MGNGLSMASRTEITSKYARAYVKAPKKDKGLILDQVMSVTGWSRDNARRRLAEAAKRPPGRAAVWLRGPVSRGRRSTPMTL